MGTNTPSCSISHPSSSIRFFLIQLKIDHNFQLIDETFSCSLGLLKCIASNHLTRPFIKNSILVITDCSDVDIDHQEKLFMTSRDRIRSSEFSKELERCIEKELREHPGLKKAAHDRRNAALKDKLADNKPLKDVLQNIFKKSTVLTKLFIAGQEISSPFNSTYTAGHGDPVKDKSGRVSVNEPGNGIIRNDTEVMDAQFKHTGGNKKSDRAGNEPTDFCLLFMPFAPVNERDNGNRDH